MANKNSNLPSKPWKQTSNTVNDHLCNILPRDEDEDGYLLFARPSSNASVVSKSIGAILAAQRQFACLAQHAVAQRAAISARHLRAVEKGTTQPTISVFLSICEAIGADPRDSFNRALAHMGYPVGFVPVGGRQPAG